MFCSMHESVVSIGVFLCIFERPFMPVGERARFRQLVLHLLQGGGVLALHFNSLLFFYLGLCKLNLCCESFRMYATSNQSNSSVVC